MEASAKQGCWIITDGEIQFDWEPHLNHSLEYSIYTFSNAEGSIGHSTPVNGFQEGRKGVFLRNNYATQYQ